MTDINYFEDIENTVQKALEEDIKGGDLTASLIPQETQADAAIICREEAVLCGRPWFDEVFRQVDDSIKINWLKEEGEPVHANDTLCEISGSARHILTAERTALNFLQTLMATATTTSAYMKYLIGSTTTLLDTRKTLPGLRLAQKYAVACGGAQNHRIGLYDAILIKENHIMAAGGINAAVTNAKRLYPSVKVEVETENLDEVQQALEAGADIIMLDNFSIDMMQQAVEMVDHRAKLEVSGNVEIQHLAELAATGVDYISTGAITKHLRAIDLSMRFKMNQ
ncbi:carboxylating nicotinate-nucleotide diphosphorylase [Thiomicrorhabdus xiamenensis]|uniref:Probable nicotinate-nucleotide pyrophosphorylase [carboxylating] n=1 Tax=Thiomicrorhabdus xiamenensis TaxID=2739063 RepID=A0A7D4NLN1_9GAMM|nr:carboxylating nicotinate-nucleotide diphosphorylase [Thiomicrorhabdus xiamenensis]QKI89354.1 carboxylating nicotinate-nucleotide diphosphorylase [Thiomicrorhabdus xiamenensis]